jgi:hypothetical protein
VIEDPLVCGKAQARPIARFVARQPVVLLTSIADELISRWMIFTTQDRGFTAVSK